MKSAHSPLGPLAGNTVAISLSPDWDGLARLVSRAGATVVRFSSAPDTVERSLDGWLSALQAEYDDILILSSQGFTLLAELARQLGREFQFMRAFSKLRRIAYGQRTAGVLQEAGLSSAVIQPATPAALRAMLSGHGGSGRMVGVIPRSQDPEVIRFIDENPESMRVLWPPEEGLCTAPSVLVERIIAGTVQVVMWSSADQVREVWEAALALGATDKLREALSLARVVAAGLATVRALEQVGITVHAAPLPAELLRLSAERLVAMFGTDGEVTQSNGSTNPAVSGAPATGGSELRPVMAPPELVRRAPGAKPIIVVIGNGMVGYKLVDKLTRLDPGRECEIVVFGEEARPAYDRVQLTSYFEDRDAARLSMAGSEWYAERGVQLRLGEKVVSIDRASKAVRSSSGQWLPYDYAVLCTGSTPFVPPIAGTNKKGVHVYRTIEDLEAIIADAASAKRAAVLGGGLLGLEAAKAAADLGLETHVVEFAPRLMPRQLDTGAARLLLQRIEQLGVKVHLSCATREILGSERVSGIAFNDGSELELDMVIVSAGIRPRDELARESGLMLGERGGIKVDDQLRTSDPNIFAVGECALHRDTIYGLVAPGYEMADVAAKTLIASVLPASKAAEPAQFAGTDQSAKLKLMGVDVASLGDPFADTPNSVSTEPARSIVYEDLVRGVYKKLVLSPDCKQLLGAILVGDNSEYGQLLHLMRSQTVLPDGPEQLILGARDGSGPALAPMPDTAQICSCNNVTRGEICKAVREGGCGTVATVRECTKAGTGCGGCLPLVQDIVNAELKAAGKTVKSDLCEHFAFSRQELYQIVKVTKAKTFDELLASHGKGNGCEVCKPAVASILASVHNDLILRHATLQDTNDRFLANIQRGGLYSVVPRIPAGEITPDQLLTIGTVAKKYNLYTKITGGQRIDMFGAQLHQLPDIWADLVAAGFESGHAYGKAMRTVKSCVGSTWCRFGVQDSVGFAVRVEQRYKGIRAPHKLKSAVSGCIRECAEAQSKDFGLIATEKGYNLYVCGNGGARPRHADLLAADLDEETAIRYVDRFLMYYIATADRLMRTSTWVDKMEGGIDHLRDVVVEDRLGIAEQLERDMQQLVDTYRCEWSEVVSDPDLRARFRHFANSNDQNQDVEFVIERGQRRPIDWPKNEVSNGEAAQKVIKLPVLQTAWVPVARVKDVPEEGGIAIRHGKAQIALFNFASRGEWYATQNTCPHMKEAVLSRGLIGDQAGTPKVACPIHKKTFSLQDGHCMSGDPYSVRTFPVKVQDGTVYLDLPEPQLLEQMLPAPAMASCGEKVEDGVAEATRVSA